MLGLSLLITSCQKDPIGGQDGATSYTEKTATEGGFTYTYVEGDPMKVRIYTLENGLKVYLSVNKDKPRIDTKVAVAAGSKNDPAHATGLAHYLEHMVFKGTSKLGTQDWAKEKVLLDSIENLFNTYRSTTDPAKRKQIYSVIDKVSGEAAKYAIANEYDKLMTTLGATGTNAYTWLDQTVYINDIPSNNLKRWALVEAERFGEMVPRLFHTELEAVYEEKNRGLDDDNNKVFESLFAGLFPTHTYGTQTTIGTVEHLKNPSITEIKKFFDTYYVPNNMAVVLSGDLDPTETMKVLQETFGKLKAKQLPEFSQPAQPELQAKTLEIVGPSQESAVVAWRLPGYGTREALLSGLLSAVLSNGQAGVMDVNLNDKQVVLGAGAGGMTFKEYGIFYAQAAPRQGQALEEVRNVLLAQLDSIKTGHWDTTLLKASINNLLLQKMQALEDNNSRGSYMVDNFVNGGKWLEAVKELDEMKTITAKELMAFVGKYFANNYVAVLKRNGVDKNIVKVEKPSITPVSVNREQESPFLASIKNMAADKLQPVFVNLEQVIAKEKTSKGLEVLAVKNNVNKLGNLTIRWPMGSRANPLFGMATGYIGYLDSKDMTLSQLKKELYALGVSYSFYSGGRKVELILDGLDENLEKALVLVEKWMDGLQPDDAKLSNLKQDMIKGLQDQKLERRAILNSALRNYALFGKNSAFMKELKPAQIEAVTSAQLLELVKTLRNTTHRVEYYGPRDAKTIAGVLEKAHNNGAMSAAATNVEDDYLPLDKPQVLMAHYDMVQADMIFISRGGTYNTDELALNRLYNGYFDGNMGSIVFQELRESKALAYSCYSRLGSGPLANSPMVNSAGIGCQADKLAEATAGMVGLLDNMPLNEKNFEISRKALLEQMESERYAPRDYFDLLENKELKGFDPLLEKDIYEKAKALTLDQVVQYQKAQVANKPRTLILIGHKDKINKQVLAKYGPVQQLSLEEIFGY